MKHAHCTPSGDPRKETLVLIKDVSRLMGTYFDQRATEHGMTRAQWVLLGRLSRQEGLTQTEMAEILEMQPISLVRLVDKLTEQGLIERRPHPTDRRANLLFITDAGRATLEAVQPTADDMLGRIFDGFSPADLDRLSVELERVKTNIKDAMAHFAAQRAAPRRHEEEREAHVR
ncbi:MarR family winged helix-turn-helix transcriptional regulator [Methyloraptor flagellatus]|jgi:MarR family transcriptional regulator for hemolysin|uniref:MarR family transcriptional regulator n=1 Tax=Methyloraptor flagellatus TaxID=3162530 RepID=A0AAU7XCL2_9HYPH